MEDTDSANYNILKIVSQIPSDGIERVDNEETFKCEEWQEVFKNDIKVYFQLIHMKDSYYIWIGTDSFVMDDLHLAMKTRFSEIPSIMGIIDTDVTSPGYQISQRLCKKTGKSLFVSFNVKEPIPHLIEFIEIKLSKKFKELE